jgi:hypothetical protein
MKTFVALSLAALVTSAPAGAGKAPQAPPTPMIETFGELLEHCRAYERVNRGDRQDDLRRAACLNFVLGASGGVLATEVYQSTVAEIRQGQPIRLYCGPANLRVQDVLDTIQWFRTKDPTSVDQPAGLILFVALRMAHPCEADTK